MGFIHEAVAIAARDHPSSRGERGAGGGVNTFHTCDIVTDILQVTEIVRYKLITNKSYRRVSTWNLSEKFIQVLWASGVFAN